jgi:hypothetical protein
MVASIAIRLLGSPVARRGLPLLLLGLLFACTPGASPARPLYPSNPNPICANSPYPPPASLCFSLEGNPLPGQPFTLTIDAFYYAWSEEPPYTLTLILPAALEVLNLDTSRPYTLHSSIPVSLIDPAVYVDYTGQGYTEEGVFTTTGTRIAVDLGRIGQQSLWDPDEQREHRGERVRLTLRLSEAGEWQVRGLLHQGEHIVRRWLGLLGWSAPSQAYWTGYYSAFRRVFDEVEGPQCRASYPCTRRFPYDPYRFALGVPPEAPGRPLRERPATFCERYERPGTCAEHGIHELDPWQRGLEPPPPGFCEDERNRLSIICEEWWRERPEEQEPTPSVYPEGFSLGTPVPPLPEPEGFLTPIPTRPVPRTPTPLPPRPTPTPRPTETPIPPPLWILTGRITVREASSSRPLASVRVELWDEATPKECPIVPTPAPTRPPLRPQGAAPTPIPLIQCQDRFLAQTYTQPDGTYTFTVMLSSHYAWIDPYLIIVATDDRRIEIRKLEEEGRIFGNIYEKPTEPILGLPPGWHRYDVEIQDDPWRTAFSIYDTLTRLGWEGLQREVGWSPPERLTVFWPLECLALAHLGISESKVHSCYVRIRGPFGSRPTIFLKEGEADLFTRLHEFAHFVLDSFPDYTNPNVQNPIPPLHLFRWLLQPSYVTLACPGFNHDRQLHTSPSCAWSEGWAHFLAIALKGWDPNTDLWIERPFSSPDFPRPDPDHPTNADSEWAVAAALWDLFDHLPEPWDPHADGWDGPARNGIWTLVTQITPHYFLHLRIVWIPSPIFDDFQISLPTLKGDRDGIEAFWMAWAAQHPDRPGEAACPIYRLDIFLARNPFVSSIPYGLCPPGWSAAFFQDQDDGRWTLNGPITWPTFTALVTQTTWPAIAFNTHSAPNQPVPGLRGTFWSARFSGWLLVPQPASLRFFFDRLDDGGRLLLNDTRVFESWIVHGPRDETVEPFLPAELIPITVEYAQGPAYEASLFLNWEGPGWAKELLGPIRLLGADIAPTPTPAGWDRISPLGPDRRTPPPRPTGTPSP